MIEPMSRPPLVGGLLAVLACLLLPATVLALWTDTVVSDTSAYVDTVAPLAEDRDVQEAAADRLVAEASGRLGTTIGDAALRRAALTVVRSDAFPPVWRAANREAHKQLIRVLESGGDGNGTITIELNGLFDALLAELDRTGLLAQQLPDLDPRFQFAETDEIARARAAYTALDTAGSWLPVAWVVTALLALVVGRHRRRTAIILAVGSAIGLVLVLAVLRAGRAVVLEQASSADQDLIAAVWDVVTESLRDGTTTAAVGGVVIAVVLVVAGFVWDRRPIGS
jgi:hypothetical protein